MLFLLSTVNIFFNARAPFQQILVLVKLHIYKESVTKHIQYWVKAGNLNSLNFCHAVFLLDHLSKGRRTIIADEIVGQTKFVSHKKALNVHQWCTASYGNWHLLNAGYTGGRFQCLAQSSHPFTVDAIIAQTATCKENIWYIYDKPTKVLTVLKR